jgi:S1-C subfamily serine protease
MGRLIAVLWGLALVWPAHAENPRPSPPAKPSPQATAFIDEVERFQQSVFDAAAPSVVVVRRAKSIGTGFFVTAEGLILTNRHVVGLSKKVEIETYDGRKLDGTVVELGEERLDIALVKVEGKGFVPLKMAPLANLRVGSWAATIGHGFGGVYTFTTGMISNIYPIGDDKPIVQTQIPINPGNSGGPILDRNGHAIAVVTSKLLDADNVNFSIRMDMAFKSLRLLAETCECLVVRTLPDVPVFVDGVLAGKGPRVLLPVDPGPHVVEIPAMGGVRKELVFPDTKIVELFPTGAPRVWTSEVTGREVSLQLDLDHPDDLTVAPQVLMRWMGAMVLVERRDNRKHQGVIAGFRPPATLKLEVPDGGDLFLSLWDIRRISRR